MGDSDASFGSWVKMNGVLLAVAGLSGGVALAAGYMWWTTTAARPSTAKGGTTTSKVVPQDLDVLTSPYNNSAAITQDLGESRKIVSPYGEEVGEAEEMSGLDEELLEQFLQFSSLGEQLMAMGRFTDAEACFIRCLSMMVPALGENNPFVAQTMHSLGLAVKEQGRFPEALQFLHKALSLELQFLDMNTIPIAETLAALGSTLARLEDGDRGPSLDLLERAATIFKNFESTQDTSLQLGLVYEEMGLALQLAGNNEAAKEKYLLGLTTIENLGQFEAYTKIGCRLALVYRDLDEYEDAVRLYTRLLEYLRVHNAGARSLHTASVMTSLAATHRDFNFEAKARPIELQLTQLDVPPPCTSSRFLTTTNVVFNYLPPDTSSPVSPKGKEDVPQRLTSCAISLSVDVAMWTRTVGELNENSRLTLSASLEVGAYAPVAVTESITPSLAALGPITLTIPPTPGVAKGCYWLVVTVSNGESGERLGEHRQLCLSQYDTVTGAGFPSEEANQPQLGQGQGERARLHSGQSGGATTRKLQ